MARSKAKIGERSVSGTIVGLLPRHGKNRGQRVEVRCNCGVLFSEYYSRFKRGRRKSCKHLRDETWERVRRGRLARLGPAECKRLFESAANSKANKAIAISGRETHLTKSAWVHHCKQLDTLPSALRGAIAASANKSVDAAGTRFPGFSTNEIQRIRFAWDRVRKERKQAEWPQYAQLTSDVGLFYTKLAEAVDLGLALTPDSEEAEQVLNLLHCCVEQAMARLEISTRTRGTYPQEFSKSEIGHPQALTLCMAI